MTKECPPTRCYALPIVGAFLFIILSAPISRRQFKRWIPSTTLMLLTQTLLLVVGLFLACRIIDNLLGGCH